MSVVRNIFCGRVCCILRLILCIIVLSGRLCVVVV